MQAAYYFVLVLLAGTALVCVGLSIHAIRNPRRVWDRQHGRDVKNGEPTDESLARIRRNVWIGLVFVPTVFPLFAYVLSLKFERDERELGRVRDQHQQRGRDTPKAAPNDAEPGRDGAGKPGRLSSDNLPVPGADAPAKNISEKLR